MLYLVSMVVFGNGIVKYSMVLFYGSKVECRAVRYWFGDVLCSFVYVK